MYHLVACSYLGELQLTRHFFTAQGLGLLEPLDHNNNLEPPTRIPKSECVTVDHFGRLYFAIIPACRRL